MKKLWTAFGFTTLILSCIMLAKTLFKSDVFTTEIGVWLFLVLSNGYMFLDDIEDLIKNVK